MCSLQASAVAIPVTMVLLAAGAEPASAQPRRVKAKGEVVSVTGNLITMLDTAKNGHTVRPKAESPLIEISGPWKLEEIQPGLLVRLTAVVKGSVVEGEVAELTLHSPLDGYQLGIQQDAADQPATIVGQFVRIKDGRLTLTIGKRRLTAQLAHDAAARVDSKDLRFVRKGDTIEIDAYTTNSGTLSARSIKVTIQSPKEAGDEQSHGNSKKPATKRKSTSSASATEANQEPANGTKANEGNEGCEPRELNEY